MKCLAKRQRASPYMLGKNNKLALHIQSGVTFTADHKFLLSVNYEIGNCH